MSDVTETLRRVLNTFSVVRIRRARFDNRVRSNGFVVGLTDQLVLLHSVSDRIRLEGYEVLRTRDITECVTDFEEADFHRSAVFQMKGGIVEAPRGIALASIPDVIRSVSANYPLISIFREAAYPGEVAIGKVAETLASGVRLRWITPAGRWEPDDTLYRYDSITRVEFDHEYENTLAWYAATTQPDG